MEAQQTIRVETESVRCDGGGGPLGHPAVYLKFKGEADIVCPYCSRTFILAEGADAVPGH
ncbi:MAG TPA: zinc-finger domain-containing protein [Rhodospirillales bacterium]|jgi:uncharacterized Zn-finger protein|nr:zinc-finger domain-containing protein [Rhodospirillales bacterium]